MPRLRNANANNVQRRVSTNQPSPSRPVTRAPIAKAKGTVNPTNPRYRIGGWNAMSGLFCNSGLGPGPSNPAGGEYDRNGLAEVAMRPKKNSATENMTSVAQARSLSPSCLRNRTTTARMYPARIKPQSRIEPSNAPHIAAKLYSAGVWVEPFSATYFTVKSRVMSACSMAPQATSALVRSRPANSGDVRNRSCRPRASPMPRTQIANAATKTPARTAVEPIATFMVSSMTCGI